MEENFRKPQISAEEQWLRNQFVKNWGTLNPIRFHEGQPRFILPPFLNISYFLAYLILTLFLSYQSPLSLPFTLLSLLSYYKLTQNNPSIKSESIPFINQIQVINFQNYCQSCRIFKLQEISHCQYCGVCYESGLFHSHFVGLCATEENWGRFCLFYGGAGLAMVVYLWEVGCD